MKKTIFAIVLVSMASSVFGAEVLSIDVKNRRPVALQTHAELASYASEHQYYYRVNLKAGMRVLYSASYGIGGEAAQASGEVVEKDGHFYFKQQSNPSGNLLLPPGLTFNSGNQLSLWDLGAYMDLVNRVAFSQSNESWTTSSNVYDKPQAAMVDFRGGTAGSSVFYQDALEVEFSRNVTGRSSSGWKVYYGKGIGPVALEFREDMSPSGTFKFYLGE